MAESTVFTWVSVEVAAATSLSEIEARGTVRLALKEAGLDAREVDSTQMRVVLTRLLPGMLARRGVDGAEAICTGMIPRLPQGERAYESPAVVFERLAGSGG